MLFVLLAVAVVAILLWLFLTPAGPARERSKPLKRVQQSTPRLAMAFEGSYLVVSLRRAGRSFLFRKDEDPGGAEQTITFILSEEQWPTAQFEAAAKAVEDAPFVSTAQVEGPSPARVLLCSLTGRPPAIGFLTGELITLMAATLGLDPDERVDLVLKGPTNYAIWRRVNLSKLQQMAGDRQPWLLRKFARYQLRKYDKEKRGGG